MASTQFTFRTPHLHLQHTAVSLGDSGEKGKETAAPPPPIYITSRPSEEDPIPEIPPFDDDTGNDDNDKDVSDNDFSEEDYCEEYDDDDNEDTGSN